MERITGDPITSAIWAAETFEDESSWIAVSTALKECLGVDEWLLQEESNKLSWIADSLTVTAELRPTTPLSQIRLSIAVFGGFAEKEDGLFLANSLNYKAMGGAYIYDSDRNAIDFVLYCTLADWFDFALLLFAAKTAIGQCENLSRRQDTLRFAKCTSAARPHPIHGRRSDHHSLYTDRLWDTTQIDFIGGLWLSEPERDGIFRRIEDESPWVTLQTEWHDDLPQRLIDSMDFGYQIFVDRELIHVLKENSAFARTSFNTWTDYGRAIVITLGVPFFTLPGIVDDGATHDDAARIANALNIGSNFVCVQKLGLGTWFAKGSQICFSMAIPHANLKPVLLGSPRYEIADVMFDIVNPKMTYRMLSSAISNLASIDRVSEREPQEMDSMASILHVRNRIDSTRASYETIASLDLGNSLWDLPSKPLLIYGVFNPVGPTLGSIELVFSAAETHVVSRQRHPFTPNEARLATVSEEVDLYSVVVGAIGTLHELTSVPDFIYVPTDVGQDLRKAVFEGLFRMSDHFLQSGVDLALKARQIQHQPNPWWRPTDSEAHTSSGIPELDELTPSTAYLSTASDVALVDYNLGLFQAWWQGALAFLADPDHPEKATAVVEQYTEHTLDRMRGTK